MHEDVKWLFGLLIVFGVIWYVAGGFNNLTSQKPFIKPLVNGEQTEVYGADVIHISNSVRRISGGSIISGNPSIIGGSGQIQSGSSGLSTREDIAASLESAGIQAEQIKKELALLAQKNLASPLTGKISINNINRSGTSSAGEYVVLKTSTGNKEKILLTGLRLESVSSGRGVTLPKGVQLPFQNQVNVEQPIYLSPGDTAYIYTGRSPLGVSFRLNKCTGFFNQFQSFNPSLPSRCPDPSSEPLPPPASLYNDQCIDYINSLSSCQVIIKPPLNISPECQRYVTTEINYTKCVEYHKNDKDFYDPEWRVYLNHDDTLWKSKREIIHLVDRNGKIIDVVTY